MHLQGLTRLRRLSLADTKITSAGLAHLRGLSRLESLSLDWTGVDDAGIANLKALPELRYLSLHLTAVTDGGGQELQGAFPKAIIMAGLGRQGSSQGHRSLRKVGEGEGRSLMSEKKGTGTLII